MKRLAPAIPLITVDPFFSVWSCGDRLHDETTRHWCGKASPIVAAVRHNKWLYYLAGMEQEDNQIRGKIPQTDVEVTPLSTKYTFENNFCKVVLIFTTPLLLDRLDILSRPVSYVQYQVTMKEEPANDTAFLFGVNGRTCINDNRQQVVFKKCTHSVCVGNAHQNPLAQSGDAQHIDWGYLHIADSKAKPAFLQNNAMNYVRMNDLYYGQNDMPYLVSESKDLKGVITLGYDEIYALEYFHKPLKETFYEQFSSFDEMLCTASQEYDEIKALCDAFDAELMQETAHLGAAHQHILAIAYRQAIAAHKLAKDTEGNLIFMSKENYSNGCIATMDVTYPSIPLFLKYNPELVLGMLRPVFKYAKTDQWKFPYCPHDVGQYPIANGQVYGDNREEFQMPIEECGNALICLAAAKQYGADNALYEEYKDLIKQWADYLVKFGYDPGNQLCTDDFAGHLSHNCNLSVKAIMGIACYSLLSGDKSYMDIAEKYAKQWETDAKNDKATRLTFDNAESWSLKYNMVWDNILHFNLFSHETKQREIALYKEKCNRYGIPLDSRAEYTKIDWLMWVTRLWDDAEFFELVNNCIIRMMEETQDRIPLTDWYETVWGNHCSFQARSVVGGLFIQLL